MSIRVKVDISGIKNQVASIGDNAEGYVQRISAARKEQIADEFTSRVTSLVPMKTGELRDSVECRLNGLTFSFLWSKMKGPFDVATYRYENPANNYTTPGTTDHWVDDFVYDGRRWNAFIKACEKILRK